MIMKICLYKYSALKIFVSKFNFHNHFFKVHFNKNCFLSSCFHTVYTLSVRKVSLMLSCWKNIECHGQQGGMGALAGLDHLKSSNKVSNFQSILGTPDL